MKKKIIFLLLFPVIMLFVFCATKTFAIYRKNASADGDLSAATWSISRSTSQQGDSIDVIPELASDTYNLTVTSSSEVDVTYTIIISNLPSGVEVLLDNDTTNVYTPTSGTITIDAGTINYNDAIKTKNHTLTFRATSNAQYVNSQEIDIDVEFKQTL